MVELGQGNVRQGMAKGVDNLFTLTTGWQNWGSV